MVYVPIKKDASEDDYLTARHQLFKAFCEAMSFKIVEMHIDTRGKGSSPTGTAVNIRRPAPIKKAATGRT